MRRNNKLKFGIIFLLLCIFGIGYAVVTSNLSINGFASFRGNIFDVHFENITVTNGSIEINTSQGDIY